MKHLCYNNVSKLTLVATVYCDHTFVKILPRSLQLQEKFR